MKVGGDGDQRPRHGAPSWLSALHESEIAQGGTDDRLARLIAVRDCLKAALEGCESPRDLPGLSREYRLVMAEIESLHTQDGADVVDQLAERRRAQVEGGPEQSAQ